MQNLTTRYGIRRPLEVADRLATLCARFRPMALVVAAVAPTATVAPLPRVAPSVPYGDPRDAETYFPWGVEEAPEEIEPAPSAGNPAPLWAVDRAAILADAAAIEREFAWRRAGCPVSPLAVEEAPFRFGFDDLPAEYFAACDTANAPELALPLAA
jgi:hypothetical protein